jgi:hypothetical protein
MVAVVPIDEAELEDFTLSKSQAFAADLADAEKALAAGKTRSASDVFDELESKRSRTRRVKRR